MISTATAQRIKAAGFPQRRADALYFPVLEEIIDAIGSRYHGLVRTDPTSWVAFALKQGTHPPKDESLASPHDYIVTGASRPEEAVADL